MNLIGFDLETNSLDMDSAVILEAGLAEKVDDAEPRKILDCYVSLSNVDHFDEDVETHYCIYPLDLLSEHGENRLKVLHLLSQHVLDSPSEGEPMEILVGHNVSYDLKVLLASLDRHGMDVPDTSSRMILDTMLMAQHLFPGLGVRNLSVVHDYIFGTESSNSLVWHGAGDDALASVEIANAMLEMAGLNGSSSTIRDLYLNDPSCVMEAQRSMARYRETKFLRIRNEECDAIWTMEDDIRWNREFSWPV